MSTAPSTPTGLLFSQDLFFTSQITGTASKLGFQIDVVGNSDNAMELINPDIRCLILDLSMPGLSVSGILSSIPEHQTVASVAYGSHVNTRLLNSARESGCTEVLPKSRFTAELPAILRRYLGEESD